MPILLRKLTEHVRDNNSPGPLTWRGYWVTLVPLVARKISPASLWQLSQQSQTCELKGYEKKRLQLIKKYNSFLVNGQRVKFLRVQCKRTDDPYLPIALLPSAAPAKWAVT